MISFFKYSVIFTVLFLYSCSVSDNCYKANNSEMDHEEYEIISSGLEWFLRDYKDGNWLTELESYDSIYSGNKRLKVLLIPDSTNIEEIDEGCIKDHQIFDSSDNYITRSVEKVNKRKYPVNGNKITTFESIILSGEDKHLSETMGFKDLYKKYPESWGIVTFSRPVYDMKTKRAALYLRFSKDGMWAKIVYMWLTKDSGKWVPYDMLDLYVV